MDEEGARLPLREDKRGGEESEVREGEEEAGGDRAQGAPPRVDVRNPIDLPAVGVHEGPAIENYIRTVNRAKLVIPSLK